MPRPLAVQLYSLREKAKEDFPGVLRTVADIGYAAVEPAGLWNYSPKEFRRALDDLGLRMFTSHSPWANGSNDQEVIDVAGELGLRYVVCGSPPADFADLDAMKRKADSVNRTQEVLAKAGLVLFQHNHDYEFQRMEDGRLKYEVYAELAPAVKFQIDAFWAGNFGANDPAEMVRKFAGRTVSLHIKDGTFAQDPSEFRMVDGYLDRKLKLVPLGTGQMDIPAIVAAAPAAVEALVVELDYCEIDMVEAIRRSYRYMVDQGLGVGRKP